MIDAVILTRNGYNTFNNLEGNNVSPSNPQIATELEINVDQHFGIRIDEGQHWTTISFREAGEWSAPQDTRKVIRAALMK